MLKGKFEFNADFFSSLVKPKAPPLIGVDISSSSVKMVELSSTGKGKYRLERATAEFFVLLDGHWILTGDDGDIYDLKAGDTLLLRKGWKGIAEIIETIRKVYITWE